LCKNEFLGRCHGSKHHGKDVSLSGETDLPICDEYEYGGSPEHLIEIEKATALGVTFLEENFRSMNCEGCICNNCTGACTNCVRCYRAEYAELDWEDYYSADCEHSS
jgi:hypothetical protein